MLRRALIAAVLAALVGGCQYPQDPDDTLNAVREGGVLRVGVTVHSPWVTEAGEEPRGIEPQLVERFAAEQGAEVEWTEGSEAEHVEALVHGRLDLVIGGWEKRTPYKKHVAITRPYTSKQVMAVRLGENAMLVALERFLLRDPAAIERIVRSGGDG